MDLMVIYKEILDRIRRLDFNKLWPRFSPYNFALYNSEEVYLIDKVIPYNESFLGNTSINYNGEIIAIWNMDYEEKDIDLDILASNIIHEMFHAFQAENKETRYPDDFKLLDYPSDVDNFSLKLLENRALVDSLVNYDSFKEFISIRNYRKKLIGDMIKQEFLAECIEGAAEFVGTLALKELSNEKFIARVNDYKNKIVEISMLQFDIRRISYYTGTLFFLALLNEGMEKDEDLSSSTTYFETVQEKVTIEDYSYVEGNDESLIKEFNKFINQKNNKFNEFFSKMPRKIEIESRICGYDPMNMIKMNSMILCENFIILESTLELTRKFIKGPLVVEVKPYDSRKTVAYYT